MKYIAFLLFITLARATQLKYNTKYCISKPHWSQTPKPPPLNSVPKEIEKDYIIPKWVYKRVFKKNKPNFYKE